MIVVTHDRDFAAAADRVIVVSDGRIAAGIAPPGLTGGSSNPSGWLHQGRRRTTACHPLHAGRARRRSAMGHQDQFRPPSLNGGCRLGKATFAGMGGKEEDAPKD